MLYHYYCYYQTIETRSTLIKILNIKINEFNKEIIFRNV